MSPHDPITFINSCSTLFHVIPNAIQLCKRLAIDPHFMIYVYTVVLLVTFNITKRYSLSENYSGAFHNN